MSTLDKLTNDTTGTGAIWNPNAAANWSLLFTPAFGAYLQMLNWRTLGEPQRAAGSKRWFIIGLGMLVLYIVIALLVPDAQVSDRHIRSIGLLYLLAWYFVSGRAQAKYVKQKFGTTYARKPWGKALLYAVGAIVAYLAIVFVVGVVIGVARSVGSGA